MIQKLKQLKTKYTNKQYHLIHSVKWDYLIILDACRADIFKECWKGPTQTVVSPASETRHWIKQIFPQWYPITIYSSNPFINSLGIGHWKYHAKNHFKRIVDLWDVYWSHVFGTVHPKTVYEKSKNAKSRSIIWFLQPHAPYLSKPTTFSPDDFRSWNKETGKPLFDHKELRKLYTHNLRIALPFVYMLINELKGTIIVTSDHGELLGEYNQTGHPTGLNVPELRNVPWVVIKK